MILPAIAPLSRLAAAEGAVLLKNDNNVLPITNERIAVFGRHQLDYLSSGSGSGGSVNTADTVSVLRAFEETGLRIDTGTADLYRRLVKRHPRRISNAFIPDFRDFELKINDSDVKAAAERTDKAIIVIGRRAGECCDLPPRPCGYYLSPNEKRLLKQVSRCYKSFAVLLNCGNILDMSWIEEYNVPAVMYIWHGGGEGGRAAADLVSGRISPSGRLTDTIAKSLDAYPPAARSAFGNSVIYSEGIYVGYRYFETKNKNAVLFPFGYGLSYTEFETECTGFDINGSVISLDITVKNIGSRVGKEVAEVYIKKPSLPGAGLDNPARELTAYAKTTELPPGGSENLKLSFDLKDFASFSERENAWIIPPGGYTVYAGGNVRDAKAVLIFNIGKKTIVKRAAKHKCAARELIGTESCESFPQAAADGRLKEFTAGLSLDELCALVHGEGMNSRLVTPGTAAAFGGVTKGLREKGIPAACAADGPSGLRMDSGEKATLLPCGVCIASAWDIPLTERLYEALGKEAALNNIDMLLGPGMNIHRTPLCGRNFEYFSEDPYLSGKTAAAAVRGLARHGISGVIKHFACNNIEHRRTSSSSVVSGRALREIYLKGFETAVRTSPVNAVMTSYNLINGIHSASNPKLTTDILRREWGFSGMVMTDWYAKSNTRGTRGSRLKLAEMIKAQNDIYMVVPNGCAGTRRDNLKSALAAGKLTKAELQRSAYNILNTIARLRCARG